MMNFKSGVLEIAWWILDRLQGDKITGTSSSVRIERWKESLVKGMKGVKSGAVVAFVKGDEVSLQSYTFTQLQPN